MKTLALAIATTALTATVAAAATGISSFDANGDRFASFDEVVAVNATLDKNDFRGIDINRDNRLSASEVLAPGAQAVLKRGATSTGGAATVSGFASEAQLAAAYPGLSSVDFHLIDANNDNRQGGQILVSLDSVDVDGSGFASLSELQAVYPGLSSNDLIFFDANDDNRISFTEFYSLDAIQTLGKNK
ncbi:unnamed protein product [Ectocarpus sp. 12 AP-2014]